jgi:hypothetical protein
VSAYWTGNIKSYPTLRGDRKTAYWTHRKYKIISHPEEGQKNLEIAS